MGDQKNLWSVLAATAVVTSLFAAYSYFTSPSTGDSKAGRPRGGDTVDSSAAAGDARRGSDAAPEVAPQAAVADRGKSNPVDAAPEQTVRLRSEHFEATVSSWGGLKRFELLGDKFVDEDDQPVNMVTTDQRDYLPLRLELVGATIPGDARWQLEKVGPGKVRMTWRGDGLTVVRSLEAGQGPYQLWSTVRVFNASGFARTVKVKTGMFHYVRRKDEEGGFFASRSPHVSHAVCRWGDDETTRMDRDATIAPPSQPLGHGFGPGVEFVGVHNSFFATVIAAHGGDDGRCQIRGSHRGGTAEEPDGTLFETRAVSKALKIEARGDVVHRSLAYLGPMDAPSLYSAGHGLSEVVDLGWFAAVARYLVAFLREIHDLVGNWGLAIILMTLLVRVTLFPLTWKSFQSMARMRVLKPEMDRINEVYGDDREKKGAAMMELYRKHRINPVGGCLPQLLQMPVWFAFYASLSTNVELYHADFILWWTDLSAPDPYYVLPLLLGGLMFVQQRITPTTMDPAQAKVMMYVMPIMITSFMLFLPAGLCLYMVTNSVLGIGQQQFIQRGMDPATSPEGEGVVKDADNNSPAPESVSGGRHGSVVRVVKPGRKKRRTRRA